MRETAAEGRWNRENDGTAVCLPGSDRAKALGQRRALGPRKIITSNVYALYSSARAQSSGYDTLKQQCC